jgi:hypothetical protein
MKPTLSWGLLLAALNMGLLLLGHALGYQAERVGSGAWLYLPAYLGMFAGTGLGARAACKQMPAAGATFGQGVRAGLKIALLGGVIAGGYAYLHFRFIAAGYTEHLIAHLRTQPAFQSLDAASADAAVNILRVAYSPAGLALATPIVHVVVGLLGAMAASAWWRCSRRNQPK